MNEQQVRDALHRIAETGGAPDEGAAWERIAARVGAEHGATSRRRWYLGLGGLAVAGAAAAAFVVLAGDDDREAVDVRPPATEPDPAGTTVVAPTTTTPPGLPARPLAVVFAGPSPEEFGGIAVYDADTGELVHAPVGPTPFSYGDVSITSDGTLWFTQETGDTSSVVRVAWGSDTLEVPFGSETRAPAVSPDGSTVAFVHDGVTVERPSIRIVDLASGAVRRELFWADDEEDFFLTGGSMSGLEWSPDGRRLLFVSSYEGSEVRVLDADATTLSDSTQLVVADSFHVRWLGDDELILVDTCCYPDHSNLEVRRHDLASGAFEVLEVDGDPVDVDGLPDGTVAILTDGGVRIGDRTIEVGPAFDIGW
jgi:dipeptidyl aminopeptidase/acylaminoacyl peptidase